MRMTPALALLASFLASSAVGVLASHPAGHGNAPAHIHRRSCKLHHKRADDGVSTPAPAAVPQPWDASAGSGDDSDLKKHKKHKGKCALKPKPKKPDDNDQGSQGSDVPPITGAPTFGGEGDGYQPPSDGGASTGGQPGQGSGPVDYSNGGKPGGNADGDNGSNPGANPGANPDNAADNNNVESAGQPGNDGSQGQTPGQEPKGYGPSPSDYSPTPAPNNPNPTPKVGPTTDDQIHCKGLRGSTFLPSSGTFKPHQFSPDFIHHGPGTSFGGGNNFWQGGACMFDDLPHANLPSVAMDQTFYQDGLACGTCVEIAPTSASLFSNDAKWSVETPKVGKLPPGKKTVAIVSDLCPGVNQCWSGLDMHPDAWKSVTGSESGSKLPINWKFVNCKEAFESSGSGGKSLQIHWRPGANAGFFEVQVRGSHEAVVRVEMKVTGKGWSVAKHVDNSWWKWDGDATATVKEDTAVVFRVTDWQGQTITSEVGTVMGKDLVFEANFDRVGGSGSEREGHEA
ncbi:hypothetical protein NDA16_004543 [Ustilago loliicola]|nr:hypothetical protein NDA16_004543 [Ustilago loliicola]